MADAEDKDIRTFKEKMLFYTTAFFILLGTFSLFAFLFLVPFVIDPAFTTIFMEFNEVAALCVTTNTESFQGVSNCSWTSCREGCTKDVYTCTQIRVNYKILPTDDEESIIEEVADAIEGETGEGRNTNGDELGATWQFVDNDNNRKGVYALARYERAIREYDYNDDDSIPFPNVDSDNIITDDFSILADGDVEKERLPDSEPTGLMGNNSEWFFTGAKLFPNVKGCGYPPILNCSIFYKKYMEIGTNFSCYYSTIDPGIVISELDMWQVYMNLVYAMAIPIPSFIASVIYLTFAYFKIYNDDEETAPLEANAEDMDVEGANTNSIHTETPIPPTSGAITPGSEVFREDLASFGHQLKVKMADEMSRESLVDAVPTLTNSISIPG
ncbi:protein tipE [Chrysoperla carnea]|uniref:protein tipE n=1 Tax=Chrysoperla carnea TaxID=189513 RepID=UPI001D065A40|nr:protein tipE [Chrysoperla carnea]